MRLTYTNAAFTHHGVPMPGVPVLLNDEMAIVEGPQRWLFYIALDRGRTRSRETWRSYAEALYDWLQTCQANAWAWDDIEEGHLRAYRNQMLYHPSSVTGRAYSPRTINGRLRRLAMFYSWAFRRGLIARLPFEYETVRTPLSAPMLICSPTCGRAKTPLALDLTIREYRTIPSALSVEDLRRVRTHLTARDALIADWAVSTGARRMEVLGLTPSDIPDSHALGNAPFVAIPIIGKGGRRRALQVPLAIIDRTNRYIGEWRGPFAAPPRRRTKLHFCTLDRRRGEARHHQDPDQALRPGVPQGGRTRHVSQPATHLRHLHACHADAAPPARGGWPHQCSEDAATAARARQPAHDYHLPNTPSGSSRHCWAAQSTTSIGRCSEPSTKDLRRS